MRHLFTLILGGTFALASAQQHTFPGKYLDQPPNIDGTISDEEWRDIPSAEGGYDEQTGAPVPYRCRYWVAYDKSFIYIAAKLADPDPNIVHATEYRQNVSLSGDDHVAFKIDPFGTLNDGSQFQINPRGATNVFIAGGRAAKREWLGEFFARGRTTTEGWEVEARIPWSIMRLPPAGIRDLRVTFIRVIQRTGRAYVLDDISGGKNTNAGIWTHVEVPKPVQNRTLKLLPYIYAGADRDGEIGNAGMDLKAPITSDLDFVGSVNPDFRNIENQVLSIDFSYFERLAGESRPFFLEGANYFETSRDAPLFASQRISNFDVGAKVYGKLTERSTFAFLNTTDIAHQNDLAAAFTYNFGPKTSSTLALTNLEEPGLSNQGTFVSLNHQFGPFGFFAQHMTTNDTLDGSGHRYNTGITYQANGIMNDFEYVEISPKFLPRLGFAPERDFKGFLDMLEFSHPTRWGSVIEVDTGFGFEDLRTFEGSLYRRSVGVSQGIVFRDGLQVELEGSYQEFQGFKDRLVRLAVERPRNDPYRQASLTLSTGNLAGMSYKSIRPTVTYRPWKHLQLSASYQRVEHGGTQEQAILSGNYEIGLSDSIGARAIRQGGLTNFYLAYRRTGNRGNEYYLIIGDPNAASFRASVILKAVLPFEFRF